MGDEACFISGVPWRSRRAQDGRLDNQLSTTYGAYQFWAISFVWGFVVSLPHVLAAGVPLVGRPKFGSPTDYLGLGLFALGLAIETAADLQKWYFKQDASNRGKFCDVGVWQISQHPNWFGNIVLWSGITLLNVQTLLALERACCARPAASSARPFRRALWSLCSTRRRRIRSRRRRRWRMKSTATTRSTRDGSRRRRSSCRRLRA